MELVDEIKYYCELDQPTGSFMINGEWGVGKTYFIENVLRDELKEDYILIRISLFGLPTVDDINKKVKEEWILAATNDERSSEDTSKRETVQRFFRNAVTIVKAILPDNVDNGINAALDFFQIENRINGKKVILVFDDLERSQILIANLLGCINDYLENKHFHTIIIANEEEINPLECGLSFDEMKEKIVQRDVKFVPDYKSVVDNIVNSDTYKSNEYKSFLIDNRKWLIYIFSEDTDTEKHTDEIALNSEKQCDNNADTIQTSHNIRSLKCALQDFERVYHKLKESNADCLEKWLCSFVCFEMAYKTANYNNIPEVLSNALTDVLKDIYPGIYNSHYASASVFDWVRYGFWDDDAITADIDNIKERDKAVSPVDKVRTNRIMDLEDSDLKEGFPEVLKMAYDGSLLPDEYVNFIRNSCWARNNGINLGEIDWFKVKEGIQTELNHIIEADEPVPFSDMIISKDLKCDFTEEEWSAYELIDDFRRKSVQQFSNNKKEYIRLMGTDVYSAMYVAKSKRYDCFSQDMMEATYEAFREAVNALKSDFPGWFNDVWFDHSDAGYYNFDASRFSFEELENKLNKLYNEYKSSEECIAAALTKEFADTIEEMLKLDDSQ